MKDKKNWFALIALFLLVLISSVSWANNKPESPYRSDSEIRVLGPGDTGYERYIQILDEVRLDPQGVRCAVSQCSFLKSWGTPKKIRNGHYYERCLQEHRQRIVAPNYTPLQNPPNVEDLLCRENLQESVANLNPEIGSRAFNKHQPLPSQPVSPATSKQEAERALEALQSATENTRRVEVNKEVRRKSPRRINTTAKKSNRGFLRNPKIAQLLETDPEGMQRVVDKYAERRKGAIRCIPRNTELVQLDEDGDVYLFVRQGADVADLKRCFPKHGFDARMTAHNNSAAAIIPYYLKDSNKPVRGGNLVFHEGRWNIKKPQWKESGRTFYADWFKEHKDKKFGFALQAGQKIFLRMADTWEFETEEESDTATDANKAKPKHDYNSVDEEIDQRVQCRLAENTATNELNSNDDFDAGDRGATAQPPNPLILPTLKLRRAGGGRLLSLQVPDKGFRVALDLVGIDGTTTQNQSAGRAYIRAGPRVDRVMYISQERYRQKNDGTDLNNKFDNVHLLSQQEKMLCRGRYGAYAFS